MARKTSKDPTPEELAKLEKEAIEAEKVWQEYLKRKVRKPEWMIDENSTIGEVLEYRAFTMPIKWQQLIELYEIEGKSLFVMAEIFDDDPKEKERWLKRAEYFRDEALEMRKKTWLIRAGAEDAKEEMDELI